MKALSSLLEFLEKESQKYTSSPKRINAVRTWSDVECRMSSPFQTNAIKIRCGIFFYISLDFPWIKWNDMYRFFRKDLRQISMWFKKWHVQEYTWGVLFKILSFRRYWHWCHWQQPDLSSFLLPQLKFSPIIKFLWKRLLPTWRVSN